MAKLIQIECVNHPGREGIGVCAKCRKTICVDCSSRLQNVLHCRGCLDNVHVALNKQNLNLASISLASIAIIAAYLSANWSLNIVGKASRAMYAEFTHWRSFGAE